VGLHFDYYARTRIDTGLQMMLTASNKPTMACGKLLTRLPCLDLNATKPSLELALPSPSKVAAPC
jgi:hypothetical protein